MIFRNKILYFLGIGGIGMSALARWCQLQGAKIYGYDLQPSKLTNELISEGMNIHFETDITKIPDNIEMVIYTPAIPSDNAELKHFEDLGITIMKRAELIGRITHDIPTIAVAGTHGKTSISALIAHILKNAGINISAFVGGISRNYNTNLIISETVDYLVVEADEFDRSLLRLDPNIAVVSSMDEDHLDIYSGKDDINNTFVEFAHKVDNGILVFNSTLELLDGLNKQQISYSAKDAATTHCSKINIKEGKYVIDIETKVGKINDVEIQVPGMHNIENTLAAASVAIEVGVSLTDIKKGIQTFAGVERRMDYRINNDNLIYIDDYAHHPEEIKTTISTVKELYPDKKITGIFQPHLYSRTRDFAVEFAIELSRLDEIILMEIYPAREKPIPGITSELLMKKITHSNCKVLNVNEILDYLSKTHTEVLLTMGAGDIGLLVEEIENVLMKK